MYQPISLKYEFQDLEPIISEQTMRRHYQDHYLRYLKKLNAVLQKNNFSYHYPITSIFRNIDAFPLQDRDEILYNAGGAVNHEIYFNSLTPNQKEIPEPLRNALIQKYGSIEQFKAQILDYADSLVGSGYVFLAVNTQGELLLMNLPNQDSPYSFFYTPILAIDVWEHAYYVDYGNNRRTYMQGLLEKIDYDEVNKNYQQVINKLKIPNNE